MVKHMSFQKVLLKRGGQIKIKVKPWVYKEVLS